MIDQLAELAPMLKEAEVRVLLHLIAVAVRTGETTIEASTREIAAETRLARSAVVGAVRSLTARKLIVTRQGTPTRAGAYRLSF